MQTVVSINANVVLLASVILGLPHQQCLMFEDPTQSMDGIDQKAETILGLGPKLTYFSQDE
jgi:hypothetical protein